ncbi:hypothetical protein BJ875DRAFT_83180, partial [Amylocarpus encephaloides]
LALTTTTWDKRYALPLEVASVVVVFPPTLKRSLLPLSLGSLFLCLFALPIRPQFGMRPPLLALSDLLLCPHLNPSLFPAVSTKPLAFDSQIVLIRAPDQWLGESQGECFTILLLLVEALGSLVDAAGYLSSLFMAALESSCNFFAHRLDFVDSIVDRGLEWLFSGSQPLCPRENYLIWLGVLLL